MQLITLTTDFGLQDWFVGTMKGIVLGINPHARITDLTHGIPPGDIRAGAFALAASCRFFPKRTIHVVVVDPGVGGARQAIAVQTTDYCFVAPDNGVLSFALAKEKTKAIHRLENERFFRHPVSQTFHGRDVFAPVAAHLSRGVPIRRLGPAQKDLVRLFRPEARVSPQGIEGQVAYIDRFGNAITNITAADLRQAGKKFGDVFVNRKRLCSVADFYAAVPAGQSLALVGSTGYLEIAVNGGSAAERLALRMGQRVHLRA